MRKNKMVPDKIDLMKNNLILRMFFALFGCFMILVCVNILTLKQPIMNIRFNIIFSALFIIIIGLFYFLLDKVDLNSTKKTFGILLGIIFLGIVIRLFVRLFLQTQTISDFATPHEFYTYYQENGAYTGKLNDWQNNDKYQNYYAKYPAWYPYLRIIMLIYDIFGKRVILIQFVNIVLFSLSALLVFFIIASMTAKKMALLGVLFWSLCPSLVIYSTITTPDHFSIFFILLTIYFWIKAEVSFKEQSHKNGETKFKFLLKDNKRSYTYMILAGLSSVLVNLFKPLSILFLVAFVCVEIACRIWPNLKSWKQLCSTIKVNSFRWVLFIVTFIGFSMLQTAIVNNSIEKMFRVEVVNSQPMYLLWGYSVNQYGNYDPNVADPIMNDVFEKYNGDLPKAMEELDTLAKQTIRKNLPYLPKILQTKFQILFNSEESYWWFANTAETPEYTQAVNTIIKTPFLSSAISFMWLLYFFVAVNAINNMMSKYISKFTLINAIVTWGYILVLLLGGVQGRYKSLIVAPLCIMAAMGVYDFVGFINKSKGYFLKVRSNETKDL